MLRLLTSVVLTVLVVLAGCAPAPASTPVSGVPRVLATTSFLADIAQNVAGERLRVETLVPVGVDPHGFEPTPQDVVKVTTSDVLIMNGHGYEVFLAKLLQNAGGKRLVVDASAGLTVRQPKPGEETGPDAAGNAHPEGDPHFWLDPTLTVRYVENIRDGLIQTDPDGSDVYAANATAYIAKLEALDREIAEQVSVIPTERRLLVTNHESMGYYADRYGFRVVGAVIPSVSTDASPSAQELAALVTQVRESGARAVFLETGANAQLATQVARETGAKVVSDLYTETLSAPDGPAPTYVEMLRHDTRTIVDALR